MTTLRAESEQSTMTTNEEEQERDVQLANLIARIAIMEAKETIQLEDDE